MVLKDLLKLHGIKQNWLAQKLGVSEVSVSNWVKGKTVPKKEHLEKIARILNVPLKELTN
jgi:transcriptional regulator with XRE-family HTH domain